MQRIKKTGIRSSLMSGSTVASRGRRIRVLIDGYFIDRSYGFGRYVRELVSALEQQAAGIELLLLVPERGEQIARRCAPGARLIVRRDRFFAIWEQCTVVAVAREQRVDIVHFPYQSTALLWPRSASVMTLHDLVPLRPVVSGTALIDRLAHLYRRWNLRFWSHGSRRIVSVSEATRHELIQTLNRDSIMIPNVVGAFVEQFRDVPPEHSPPPYLLHRGGSARHKNTARVIESFTRVRKLFPTLELRVFGTSVDDPFALAHRADGVVYLGFVEERALAALYKGARAVVTASLEEGFGLTLIEAFNFGAPVITSDRKPMSDIGGDGAALLVDPESIDSIAAAMDAVMRDAELAERLRARGHERARAFSPGDVGSRLAQVYNEA